MTKEFALYLIVYGLGVFSAIGAMLLGQWIGRRDRCHDIGESR